MTVIIVFNYKFTQIFRLISFKDLIFIFLSFIIFKMNIYF